MRYPGPLLSSSPTVASSAPCSAVCFVCHILALLCGVLAASVAPKAAFAVCHRKCSPAHLLLVSPAWRHSARLLGALAVPPPSLPASSTSHLFRCLCYVALPSPAILSLLRSGIICDGSSDAQVVAGALDYNIDTSTPVAGSTASLAPGQPFDATLVFRCGAGYTASVTVTYTCGQGGNFLVSELGTCLGLFVAAAL